MTKRLQASSISFSVSKEKTLAPSIGAQELTVNIARTDGVSSPVRWELMSKRKSFGTDRSIP